jgi:hypothetical protein
VTFMLYSFHSRDGSARRARPEHCVRACVDDNRKNVSSGGVCSGGPSTGILWKEIRRGKAEPDTE